MVNRGERDINDHKRDILRATWLTFTKKLLWIFKKKIDGNGFQNSNL